MPYFTYHQNNSGGTFEVNDTVGHEVIIEADSAADANYRASNHGLYFDGVNSGQDCGCCGDRWSPVDDSDGTPAPMIYASSAYEYMPGYPYIINVIIYHKKGVVDRFVRDRDQPAAYSIPAE